MSEKLDGDTTGGSDYETLIGRAVAACKREDWELLADLAGDSLRQAPERPEGHVLMGLAAFVADDYGRALNLLTVAHEMDPDGSEIADLIAQVHMRSGNLNDGVYFSKLASVGESNPLLAGIDVPGLTGITQALNEAEVKTYLNEAHAALAGRRFDQAVENCQRELRLRQGNVELFTVLGQALIGLSDPAHALDALLAAIHMDPDHAGARLWLGAALARLGERERALCAIEKAVSLAGADTRTLVAAAVEAAAIEPQGELPGLVIDNPAKSRIAARLAGTADTELKIGYLTDVACNVDEMRILESFLTGHDRTRVQSVVFSTDVPGDATADRLKGYAHGWHDIRHMNDETVVDWMGVNHLDVLVDLTFSAFGQRPEILMANPARQVIGLFGPRPGVLGKGYHRVLRHPKSGDTDGRTLAVDAPLLAIDPETMPDVGHTNPATENGYVTFGAVLDLRFLTPRVAQVYSSVLHGMPGSRLMLGSTSPVCEQVRVNAMSCFADNGVVDRVDIREDESDTQKTIVVKRLEMMVRIDVYLETFPASAPLPAVDAMWSGVPVIAMDGDPMSGASTPGLLRGAGMSDWIADDAPSYIAKAIAAGERAAAMNERREAIEKYRKTAPFDPAANARAIEEALRSL